MIEPWQCEQHFRPEVHGLYALESVLAGHDLDFCLLYSSLSSILGGLGFVGYGAANISWMPWPASITAPPPANGLV